jgi:ribonuclease HII
MDGNELVGNGHRWNPGMVRAAHMAILVGIDEAGFGPLLGPLVVSSSVFSVGPELLDADLWQVLKRSIGKTRKHLAGRLLIADSKKAYNRAEGVGHLERTVLAALRSLGQEPSGLRELLGLLCPACLARLLEYPWYQETDDRHPATGLTDLRIAARVLADDLQSHGARLMHLRSRCLDVAYYNTMVTNVRNKAHILFIATTGLIQSVLDEFPHGDIHILIDRQGGRVHYRNNLLRSFAEMDLRIVQEEQQRSVYELRGKSRMVRLVFEVGADAHRLPVALASMVSKYVRELLMQCINRYFVTMAADVRPTAGYWKDGQRFLNELQRHLPHLEIDSHRLIRCR